MEGPEIKSAEAVINNGRFGTRIVRFETGRLAQQAQGAVAAYLDEGASHSRAAKRLGIHENTVRYRIRQAEELLGRPVDEQTLDLRVALKLADVVRGEQSSPAA